MRSVPSARASALLAIAAHRDWGMLDARRAWEELCAVRDKLDEDPAWAPHRNLVESALATARRATLEAEARVSVPAGRVTWVDRIERLLDHVDAIARRRRASRVLADLTALRVGRERAAMIMRQISDRQKGGWLRGDLGRWLGRSEGG